MPAPTRLFVGNLPFGVSEGELSEEFGCYGAVQSVELKHKKVTDGESNSQFAFITIESDIQNINKCIQEFSQQQWKGSFLNVTVARESFMEKLKREREEEGRKKQNQTPTPTALPKDKSSEESTRNPVPLPAFKFVPKPVPVNNYINGDSKFVSKPAPVNNYTNGDNFENSKNKFDNDDSKFKSKSKYQPEFDEEYEQYPKSKHVLEYNENDDYQLSKNENGSEFNNDFAHPKHNYSQELKEPFQRKFSEVQRDYSIKKKGKVESMAPYVKQKIKIAPIVPLLAPAKPAEVKKLTAADEKRLQSIQNMKAAYNDKKSAIKIALSSVDKKVKKIIFDEDGAQIIPKETLTKDANKTNANLPGKKANKRKQRDGAVDYNASTDVGSKRNKKALFDETGSADEDDGINFDIKEQFQGESGQKLMQLQARFQSDKRFTMDERFMEEHAEEGAEEGAGGDERVDAVEDEERLRQMDILQGILGRTVRTSGKFPTKEGDVNKKQVLLKTMLRFDPNRPDHSQFMSAPAGDLPAKKSKKQRKKEREEALSGQAEEKAAPQVSQERYYKVNESLKQSLDEQKPFSLLSLFGSREPQDDTSPAEYSAISIKKSTDKYQNPLTESNPFVYDSSDNEETTKKETGEQVEESPYGIATPKALLVTENFFFSSTDPRFKEGVDFFMNIKPRSDKTREELKFLVKRRIQNNMRNERSHFKKVQQRHPAKTTKFRKR